MPVSEIAGYVLIFFQETQDSENEEQPLMGGYIPSLQQFKAAGSNLNQFVSATDVGNILNSGYPESLLVTAPDTSVILDLAPGTHHFAISAFDSSYLYSELSNTVTLTIPF